MFCAVGLLHTGWHALLIGAPALMAVLSLIAALKSHAQSRRRRNLFAAFGACLLIALGFYFLRYPVGS